MTTESSKDDPKINITSIVSSLIDDAAPSTSPVESSDSDVELPSSHSATPPNTPTAPVPPPPQPPTPATTPARKEHAKLYQREYRKRQKMERELLRETQIKGSEILMVFTNGQIVSRELRSEEDYVEMLNDFSESLKKQGSLLSFRISRMS